MTVAARAPLARERSDTGRKTKPQTLGVEIITQSLHGVCPAFLGETRGVGLQVARRISGQLPTICQNKQSLRNNNTWRIAVQIDLFPNNIYSLQNIQIFINRCH